MSHTSRLKSVKITDIQALQAAVDYLVESGIHATLETNIAPRLYYANQSGPVDYVVKLPNAKYDVGFDKQDDGSYYPIFDSFGGSTRAQVGAPPHIQGETPEEIQTLTVSKLVDLYGVMASKNQLESQGFTGYSNIEYNSDENSYTLEVAEAY